MKCKIFFLFILKWHTQKKNTKFICHFYAIKTHTHTFISIPGHPDIIGTQRQFLRNSIFPPIVRCQPLSGNQSNFVDPFWTGGTERRAWAYINKFVKISFVIWENGKLVVGDDGG